MAGERLQGGQVQSSDVSFYVAPHTSLKTIPSEGWVELPYESIGSFGAEFTKVSRTNVGKTRGSPKSSITGLTSPFAFTDYITLGNLRKFVPAMLYSQEINEDVMDLEISAIAGTASARTLTLKTALDTTQITRLKAGTLLQIDGANTISNNKLVEVSVDATATSTLTVTGGPLTNAAEDARVSFAGYRKTTGSVTWTYSDTEKTLTLAMAGIGTALIERGIRKTQTVWIGSPNASRTEYTNTAVNADGPLHGSARVKSISAGSVVFDLLLESLQGTPTAPTQSGDIDILFSTSCREVAGDHSDFCERAFAFTQETLGLGDGTDGNTDNSYETTVKQFPNTLELTLVDEGLSTMTVGFSGSDTRPPTTTPPVGLDAATTTPANASFSTSSDIARLSLQNKDETGLTTDFTSATLSLNNNVTGRRVLGRLGPKFQNLGNFAASMAAEVLFTTPLIPQAIRNNETVGLRFGMQNDNGAFFLDMPANTLDGGGRSYPVNDSVTIATGINAHEEERFDNSTVMFSTVVVPLLPVEQEDL